MIPQAETMIAMPAIPANMCLCPFCRAVASSPCIIISTIPQTKTMIATANMSMMSGLTILTMIGSITDAKAAVGSFAACAMGTIEIIGSDMTKEPEEDSSTVETAE